MNKLLKAILILFVVLSGVCLFILSNNIGGWRVFTVMSASMEPAILTGSVVFVQRVNNPEELKKGEIITFTSPTKERMSVTHRIVSAVSREGGTAIKTKGDRNKSVDSWTVYGGSVIGKVHFVVPYIGYGFSFLKTKTGILLLIVFPSLWVVVDEINTIFSLFRMYRKKSRNIPVTAVIFLFVMSGLFLISAGHSMALLSDSVILVNNTYKFSSENAFPSPTPIFQPTPSTIPSSTPAVIPIEVLVPTTIVTTFEFPSCNDPKGTVISSYETGMHEIVGVGLLSGSDVVYQLSEGSKDRVMQCYCPESGVGIQTNWLKTTDVERLKKEGWLFSIDSGVSWNLDEGAYVARNVEYSCK
jgi:signal peptidase